MLLIILSFLGTEKQQIQQPLIIIFGIQVNSLMEHGKTGKSYSQGNNIIFSKTIAQSDLKYVLDADNYLDICVVASLVVIRIYRTLCYLSTNYIQLALYGEKDIL